MKKPLNLFVLDIKARIERFTLDISASQGIFGVASGGSATLRQVGQYLFNLKYMLAQATLHIGLSEEIARTRGNAVLAGFFKGKIREEVGHDLWAANDLKGLGLSDQELASFSILPATYALNSSVHYGIARDPIFYVLYGIIVEYFTVLIGPLLIEGFEGRCGAPKNCMSAIGNHVAVDKAHVHDGFEALKSMLESHSSWSQDALLDYMSEIELRLNSFSLEMAGLNDSGNQRAVRDVPASQFVDLA